MRDSIVNIVHSIIRHGLSLRDRLEAGEALDPAEEHATVIEMLAPLALEEIWDAEQEQTFGLDMDGPDSKERRHRLSQATIRCVLVCWLDMFLVRYSLWGSTWNEHSFEVALYGTNSQGKYFWGEARYAETRKDLDALEVIYWCVMLGFRGEGRELAEPTGVWASRIRTLLDESVERAESIPADWESPVQRAHAVTDLPYRRMLFSGLLTLSLAVPAALWFLLRS